MNSPSAESLIRKSDKCLDETYSREETGLTHECGVFGCIAIGEWPSPIDIAQAICLGLVALQHRGQESAGIVTSEGKCAKHFNTVKGMGMISNIFNDDAMRKLNGNLGIGHTRYSTSAASEEVNCQPFVVHTNHGAMAVAHNGELVNCTQLREDVLARGVGLSTHSDSELITQALCLNPPEEDEVGGPNWVARIKHLMSLAPLSYSLVIMLKDRIFGVRDPYGNRPLCLGRIVPVRESMINGNCVDCNNVDDESEGYVISSESCGFLSIGARYVREVLPGEIVEMTKYGVRSVEIVERPDKKPQAFCIFEYVYFARSDSIFEGQMVYSVRLQCGRVLAKESGVDADLISSVPESGTAAAHGFARESGIAFAEVLCKNRYVGRTFIQPSTRLRQLGVAKKFGALFENVRNKKIVLVDDSIVRGNTIGPIIKLLKDAGAKEVHIRIASPPLKFPCYMGINIPTREELIANKMNSAKLAKHVGADSLEYLSVEGLIKAVRHGMSPVSNEEEIGHCMACLTGDYPEKLKWLPPSNKRDLVMNKLLLFLLILFSTRVWSHDACDSKLEGKCFCGKMNYQDGIEFVVNCTNARFTDSSVLEFLPEEVEVLIFTGNSIPELPWNVFGITRNYSRLRVIDMSNNKITEIFGKSYHRVSSVERLILNHNEISISTGNGYNHHHPRVFSNFENLKELHLTNAFSDSSETLASDLHDIFVNSNLTKLIKLHLEQNKITGFRDEKVFCDLPSIMDLYLGDNLLTGIDFEVTCLKHLRYIDLENNKIKMLSQRELQILDSFPARNQSLTLDLHNNPYSCECGTKEFFDWLQTTKVEVRRKDQIRCYHEPLSQSGLKSECLSEFSKFLRPQQTVAARYQATEILLGLLFAALVILLAALVYTNRKAIRYKMNPILENVSKKVHYTSIGHYEEQEVDV